VDIVGARTTKDLIRVRVQSCRCSHAAEPGPPRLHRSLLPRAGEAAALRVGPRPHSVRTAHDGRNTGPGEGKASESVKGWYVKSKRSSVPTVKVCKQSRHGVIVQTGKQRSLWRGYRRTKNLCRCLTSACSWRALHFKGTWDSVQAGESPQLMRGPLGGRHFREKERD
jgi:hypothetical protein